MRCKLPKKQAPKKPKLPRSPALRHWHSISLFCSNRRKASLRVDAGNAAYTPGPGAAIQAVKESLPSGPAPGSPGPPIVTIAFAPLLAQGLSALAPEPALGIVKILLVKAGFRWHNAFNESTVRKADDLFACAAQDGACYDPIPKDAELTGVTLEFYFTGSPGPHWVELSPPRGLRFQYAEDREKILELLTRRLIVSF